MKEQKKNVVKAHISDVSYGTPSSSLLCAGSKVAIENRNFCSEWGLHSGATVVVHKIVFNGHNPDVGGLPLYVVVKIKQHYCQTWDENNKKVCVHLCGLSSVT